MIALASEDPYIEIAKVDTGKHCDDGKVEIYRWNIICIRLGERVYALKCDAQTFAVAWHPRASVLAYVQDDDSGNVRLFGVLD